MSALPRKERAIFSKTVEDVIKTFKSLVERQEDEAVRAIYGSSPYRLSVLYKDFEIYFYQLVFN